MSHPKTPLDELLSLADAQCNGTDDDATIARLEELMRDDPAAREAYMKFQFLHAQLTLGDGTAPSRLQARTSVARAERQSVVRWAWAVPACLAIVASISVVALWVYKAPSNDAAARQGELAVRNDEIAAATHYSVDVEAADDTVLAQLGAHDDSEWVGQASGADSGELRRGTLRLNRGQAEIDFKQGPRFQLEGDTLFGIASNRVAALLTGAISAHSKDSIEPSDSPFVVETPGVRLVERGTTYRVQVDENNHTVVRVEEGAVEVFRRTRLPRFYWSFDDESSAARYQTPPVVLGAGATRVPGIVGKGAIEFNNTNSAYVDVGNGGGKAIGSGDFSVCTGITIEAMIVSRWSGRPPKDNRFDYDEIFRKEDGSYRILLCFQNDFGRKGRYDVPDVADGPCLSFGLHLTGLGYSELDMPLDGKSGRPTLQQLQDGEPHHVVATYDAATGAKSIWIDGRLCFRHEFPRGSLIVSGGARSAAIGNFAANNAWEPFAGIIDEVAFYDFALSSDEIADHARRASAGQPYFDFPAEDRRLGDPYESITLLKPGHVLRVDAWGVLY